MTHIKCGGTITMEIATLKWRFRSSTGRLAPSAMPVEIGRCDKCGLAGEVFEPPK